MQNHAGAARKARAEAVRVLRVALPVIVPGDVGMLHAALPSRPTF